MLIRHKFHPAVWHVFFSPKVASVNKLIVRERLAADKTIFRYETSMKFANISGGFGGNLNFELISRQTRNPGKSCPLVNFSYILGVVLSLVSP